MSKKEKELKQEMIENAILIIDSVAWLGNEVDKVIDAIKKEERKPKWKQDNEKYEALEVQLKILYKKSVEENKNMDKYMKKYETLIKKSKNRRTT